MRTRRSTRMKRATAVVSSRGIASQWTDMADSPFGWMAREERNGLAPRKAPRPATAGLRLLAARPIGVVNTPGFTGSDSMPGPGERRRASHPRGVQRTGAGGTGYQARVRIEGEPRRQRMGSRPAAERDCAPKSACPATGRAGDWTQRESRNGSTLYPSGTGRSDHSSRS